MILDTLDQGCSEKVAGFRPADPPKLCGRSKIVTHAHFFQNVHVFGIVSRMLRWVCPTHAAK